MSAPRKSSLHKQLRLCTNCKKHKPTKHFFNAGANILGTHCAACRSFSGSVANWERQKIAITVKEYKFLSETQLYRCKICDKQYPNWEFELSTRLAVDHCHTCEEVRALLCRQCNLGLGNFGDNKQYLLNAIRYLEAHDNSRTRRGEAVCPPSR